jgi:methylated-DNA-protein-cysteine methyltransferase-like protein
MTDSKDNFFQMVYKVVELIPKGKVTSYGAIAKYLSSPRSSRMVGWAMNNSHGVNPGLPAHRVVNRTGFLSGKTYFGLGDEMANLLRSEGIQVENDQILNFKSHFWDPSEELNL